MLRDRKVSGELATLVSPSCSVDFTLAGYPRVRLDQAARPSSLDAPRCRRRTVQQIPPILESELSSFAVAGLS